MGIRRFLNRILGNRGYSLIMALVTVTILVLLGLAVVTISMGTLKSNEADATTNEAYYAAEAGVNSALDQLKLEVSRYYTSMKGATGSTYTGLYNNFATGIAANALTNFAEPSITGGSTSTTFTVNSYDSSTGIYEFLATTTSTMADGTKYKVEGRLKVKRVDVSAKDWFISNASLVVGGTLGIGDYGFTLNGGNAYLGQLTYNHPASWNQYVMNNGATTTINSQTKALINDVLNYPGFSDPVISNPLYFSSNSTINYALSSPVKVDTSAGVNLTITDSNIIPSGILRAKGNLTINNGGNINCDLYCNNLIEYGRRINGNIYAHGDVTIQGGDIYGNIYADGSVNLKSISVHGSVICNGSITVNGATALGNLYATGPISLSQLTASGNILYTKSSITLTGAGVDAIMFAGGDVNCIGGQGALSGAIICKNNIPLSNAYPTLTYDAASVASKYESLKGTFFRSGVGGATLDSSVFQTQSITAKGRVN